MKFVAHRGYSAKCPENTLPAFDAALNHPECGRALIGVEIDIRLTRDSQMAVFHDDKVSFENVKVPVELIDLESLRTATKERFKGELVPVLDEVFKLIGHRLELLVEMKDGAYDKKTFFDSLESSLLRYQPSKGDVILHSFSPELMEMALERLSGTGVRFGALFCKATEFGKFGHSLLARMDFIHPGWDGLLEDEGSFVSLGKPLHVWTVNDRGGLGRLRSLKHAETIRAVMTDDLSIMEGGLP